MSGTLRLPLLLLLVAATAWGQGVLVPDRFIDGQPVIAPPGTMPLPTLRQSVKVEIRDFAATTSVEQWFENRTGRRIEGTFLFPLPEEAGVTNFAMTVNGEMVGAELLDAGKAKQIYEEIVRRQRDPGLLEYLGREVFRARIFPIEAGETKKVRLEYTQAVPAESGLGRFVFPLRARAFHRGIPMPPPVPLPRPMPERDGQPGRPADPPSPGQVGVLAIDVSVNSQVGIRSVYSPTHEIDLHRGSDREVRVGYEGRNVTPEEDFILYYQLTEAMFGLSLVAHRSPAEETGTFMMLIAPKSELRQQEVAAKDIAFVFDTSGSMAGQKMEQAKGALRYSLQHLNRSDRFNVITFSTGVDAFEDALVEATPERVQEALKFVDGLEARGGTNIAEALATTLRMMPDDPQRPRMVLFMTDGQPTVGENDPAAILRQVSERNKSRARLFVFGVGTDLNVPLLDRLSLDNHGTRTFVRPEEDIEEAVTDLYGKIASPVLSDLRLDVQGVRIEDLHPATMPDLFRGSQLTLFGRYRGHGPATVVLKGNTGQSAEVFEYSVDFPERERQNSFVPRLWATRKVGYLLEQIRLHGQNKELVDEVTRLATQYGILTPYTSYLVLEPGMRPQTEVARELPQAAPGAAGGAMGPQGPPGPAGQPGRPAVPRPSQATTGADAVARSEGEERLRDADRVTGPGNAPIRTAGEKTFYLINEVWVDSTVPADTAGLTEVTVKYGSDAYFDLLGLREELGEVLAVGPKLKVKLGNVLLIVGDDGLTALSDAARQALTAR